MRRQPERAQHREEGGTEQEQRPAPLEQRQPEGRHVVLGQLGVARLVGRAREAVAARRAAERREQARFCEHLQDLARGRRFQVRALRERYDDRRERLIVLIELGIMAFGPAMRDALAKAKPGTITFATASTSQRISSEMFAHMAGIKLVHIPFKGFADGMQAMLGGRPRIGQL